MKGWFREAASVLRDLPLLIADLIKDDRVPARAKVVLGGAVIYLATPLDLIPDFLPFLGYLDDSLLVVIILDGILNHVDERVVAEHWQGDRQTLEKLKRVSRRLTFFIPNSIKRRVFQKER